MVLRPLSSGRFQLNNSYLSSIFRLLIIRIQVMLRTVPPLSYNLEQLFLGYHEELIKLKIRARFRLKPLNQMDLLD